MACMEHECSDCGHAVFNNEARNPEHCPFCGGRMHHYCDEPPERDGDPYAEVGEEDE